MEAPLSVSRVTDLIKGNLERTFSDIVVIGEVSNFKPHPSGHYYFSLKDDKACLAAVMFRQSNAKLKFKLQDGLKVVAVGRITVYPPRGNYQILITRLEPDGVGALQLAFEQLKKKLESLGYFSPDRKRPIPKFPRKIGLVTSSSGAAIRDMLNILSRRFAGLEILLYPVKVQGAGAAPEIASGISELNRFFPEIDVLIVGRGGGSIEDLWAFNEEVVAHAIYHSKIPVISAVGHEIDFTIADFVADLRAPTPSAAAELVVCNKWETLQHVDHLVKRLLQIQSRLEFTEMRLDDLHQRLLRSLGDRLSTLRLRLERSRNDLFQNSPMARLQGYKQRAFIQFDRLRRLPTIRFEKRKWEVDHLVSQLRLLNPRTIMERGYSIVRIEKTKKVVKKVSDVTLGDKLNIELHKGRITARVQ